MKVPPPSSEHRTRPIFTILLISFGILMILITWGVLYILWEVVFPLPPPICQADYEALRAKLDYDPDAIYKFDPDLSYRHKPGFEGFRHDPQKKGYKHYTNSRSLLGKNEVNPDPGIDKILVLGDSVTYGDKEPFEAIFTSRIQSLAGENYQILNGSCSGWSTHQEISFYRKYLSDIPWRVVILVFTLNDLVKFEWVYHDGANFKMSVVSKTGGYGRITASLASLRLENLRQDFQDREATRNLADHNNTTLFAWDEKMWREYEEEVLSSLVGIDKIPNLIVVALPSSGQLFSLRKGAPEDVVLYPQNKLREFCRKNGVMFIDAVEAFRGEKIDPADYYWDQFHLSRPGHQRIAEFLWARIQALFDPDDRSETTI